VQEILKCYKTITNISFARIFPPKDKIPRARRKTGPMWIIFFGLFSEESKINAAQKNARRVF